MFDSAVKKAVSVIFPNEKSLPQNAPDMVTGTLTLEITSIPGRLHYLYIYICPLYFLPKT